MSAPQRPMSDREYIDGDGQTCPYCRRAHYLEGRGSLDMANGTEVTVEIDCTACGASFIDVYRLAGYMGNAPMHLRGMNTL